MYKKRKEGKNISNNLSLGEIALIFSAVLVLIPIIFVVVLPLIKPKIKQNTSIYIYAFSSGFFLILGIFGLIQEANDNVQKHLISLGLGLSEIWGISIGIVGGAVAFVLFFALGIKYLIGKKLSKSSQKLHSEHKHDEEPLTSMGHNHGLEVFNYSDTNPKAKIYSIILLVSHKIPAGLSVGFLIAQFHQTGSILGLAFIITFLLHIIPEEVIMYYRQIEIGVKRWKATLISAGQTAIMIPLIFIGAYSGEAIINSNAILFTDFLSAAIGAIFIYLSLVEFIPELLHHKMTSKTWYIAMLMLMIGIVISLCIFIVHNGSGTAPKKHTSDLAKIINIHNSNLLSVPNFKNLNFRIS